MSGPAMGPAERWRTTMRLSENVHVPGCYGAWRLDQIWSRLRRCDRVYAVMASDGTVWDLHSTRLGAVRRLVRHRREYHRATNHHPFDPEVVTLSSDEFRALLRSEAEAKSAGDTVGALVAREYLAGRRVREMWLRSPGQVGRTWAGVVPAGHLTD